MTDPDPMDGATDDAPPAADRQPLDLGGSVAESAAPDFRAARRHVLLELLRLAADLRSEGVDVPPSGPLTAARALASVGLADKPRVEAALRASLLSSPEGIDAFADAFPTFWHRLRTGLDAIATDDGGASPDDDARSDGSATDDPGTLPDAQVPASGDDTGGGETEVLIPTQRRHASGDRATEDSETGDARRYSAVGGRERVEVPAGGLRDEETAAIDRFVDALATLPGRRHRDAPAGDRVDARRALRASLGTGGAPIDLPRTEPTPSELRCCLLVDVSGSVLDTIDRAVLLDVAARLTDRARQARVFLFDTDLVDATTAFARADGDPAATLRDAEFEWGGGTKIGAAVDAVRRQHPAAVDRRTVVVVISDGLDVGDEDLLADAVTWLADRAGALVWLNPLAVSPAFEPKTRGMATALPYVDALFGFARPADLAEAARQIERRGLGGPIGYEHDPRRQRAEAGGEGE